MTPSAFHGIFSSLGQDQPTGNEATAISPVIQEEQEELPALATNQQTAQMGQISVDIFEQDNYFIIRAPIAGVKLSDLDIEVDDRVITISGERSLGDGIPDDQYYLQECFWGKFSRSVTLPISIDPRKVRATFSKDSVLKILIPKEEKIKIIRVNEG